MGYARKSEQKGFTLVEALLGIFILAFGLMAVVTMVDVAFSAGRLSKNTTTATALAAYMLDRVRMDVVAAKDPLYTDGNKLRTLSNAAGTDLVLDTDSPSPASDPGRAAFTDWKQRIDQSGLTEARGVVTIIRNDPANAKNNTVAVEVSWRGVLTRSVRLDTTLPRSL